MRNSYIKMGTLSLSTVIQESYIYACNGKNNLTINTNHQMKKRWISLSLITFIYCNAFTQGDLLLSPTRIVFEGNKQNQELVLVNTGSDTSTYVVSFIQNRMTEEGRYERIE